MEPHLDGLAESHIIPNQHSPTLSQGMLHTIHLRASFVWHSCGAGSAGRRAFGHSVPVQRKKQCKATSRQCRPQGHWPFCAGATESVAMQGLQQRAVDGKATRTWKGLSVCRSLSGSCSNRADSSAWQLLARISFFGVWCMSSMDSRTPASRQGPICTYQHCCGYLTLCTNHSYLYSAPQLPALSATAEHPCKTCQHDDDFLHNRPSDCLVSRSKEAEQGGREWRQNKEAVSAAASSSGGKSV
jgi:hypothetical protein